nr:Hsp33 family molecular chaperone HslO [Oleiagrimonas sp. C23AA]
MLYRFLLERAGVRGVLVRLGDSWREVAQRADYPPQLRQLLGESLASAALLTGNIKFSGSLTLELKTPGALRLVFTEATEGGRLRGLARFDAERGVPDPLALNELAQAVLAITIGSAERGHRYQGLIELSAPDLATSLEGYFTQSEQLPARIVLAVNGDQAVGLMLQRLPGEGGHDAPEVDADAWDRVLHLTATLSDKELLELAPEEVLYRLYHEESVRLFDPRPLAFGCSCSRERVVQMLRSLGREEVEAALEANDGEVEVTCEFCASQYRFDRVDAEQVLSDDPRAPGSDTTH